MVHDAGTGVDKLTGLPSFEMREKVIVPFNVSLTLASRSILVVATV